MHVAGTLSKQSTTTTERMQLGAPPTCIHHIFHFSPTARSGRLKHIPTAQFYRKLALRADLWCFNTAFDGVHSVDPLIKERRDSSFYFTHLTLSMQQLSTLYNCHICRPRGLCQLLAFLGDSFHISSVQIKTEYLPQN